MKRWPNCSHVSNKETEQTWVQRDKILYMELETGVWEIKLGIPAPTLVLGSPPSFSVVLPINPHAQYSKGTLQFVQSRKPQSTFNYYQLPKTGFFQKLQNLDWPHLSTRQSFQFRPQRSNFEYTKNEEQIQKQFKFESNKLTIQRHKTP